MAKTTFVIDRSKWRCGDDGPHRRGVGSTYMLNSEGFQCCLGQIATQLGCDDEYLLGLLDPADVDIAALSLTGRGPLLETHILTVAGDWSQVNCTSFSILGMNINDNEELTDTQRERKLERLAEEYGLRIEFTGEYVCPEAPDAKTVQANTTTL